MFYITKVTLKLVLTEKGLVKTSEVEVYFPTKTAEVTQLFDQTSNGLLSLTFLHPQLYLLVCRHQSLKEWLKDSIGVKELNIDSYISQLVQSLNQKRDKIDKLLLIQQTIFIQENFHKLSKETQGKVKAALPILLSDGSIAVPNSIEKLKTTLSPLLSEIGVPNSLGNQRKQLVMPEKIETESKWQIIFDKEKDRSHLSILSDEYLKSSSSDKWRLFFKELGITDTPDPQEVVIRGRGEIQYEEWIKYEHRLYRSFKELSSRYLNRYSYDDVKLRNYRSPFWLLNVFLGKHSLDQRKMEQKAEALIKWLSLKLQEAQYEEKLYLAYQDQTQSLNSQFKYYLLNAPWFPSTKGFKRPHEVFFNTEELRGIFGNSVPYTKTTINKSLADWLGIHQKVTIAELIAYLKNLSAEDTEPDQEEKVPIDKETIEKIYMVLNALLKLDSQKKREIQTEFEQYPLIFISQPTAKWVRTTETQWSDLSNVFGDTFVYLEKEYGNPFKEFFVEQLKVNARIDDQLFADAWIQLSQNKDKSPDELESAMKQIYPVLLKVAQTDKKPAWWQGFCQTALVFTLNRQFKPSATVYIPDDGELQEIFAKKGVEFVWFPEHFTKYWALYRAFCLKSLIEHVQISLKKTEIKEIKHSQNLLFLIVKKGICLYLLNDQNSLYQHIKSNGSLHTLLETKESQINNLEITYRLSSVEIHKSNAIAYWDINEKILYYSGKYEFDAIKVEVATIIARQLTGNHSDRALENIIENFSTCANQTIAIKPPASILSHDM